MKKFNIYIYLNENNYILLNKLNHNRVKTSNNVLYFSAKVRNELTGEMFFLHRHLNILTKKEYNFLVNIDGNITKINGGRLGETFVYEAVQYLERAKQRFCLES